MTRLQLVRETTPQTSPATPTLQERVAMVRAFVDAQRVRKEYKPDGSRRSKPISTGAWSRSSET